MIQRFLQPGDGILDVGGHVGAYAERYAQAVGPTGHVVSVEPDPENAAQHRARTQGYPQVDLIEAACYAKAERAVLYHDAADSARHSLFKPNVIVPNGHVVVPMETLDRLAARVRNLRAVKLDTQGAEWHILQGGIETLMRPSLWWQVEVWPNGLIHAGGSVAGLIQLFRDHGWVPRGMEWSQVQDQSGRCLEPHNSFDIVVVRPSR